MWQRALERVEKAHGHRRIVGAEKVANESGGVRISAAEQAQKSFAADARIAREPQRRNEHRAEHMLTGQTLAEHPVEAFEQLHPLLVEAVETARQHRVNQRLLAAEVIVDGREVDLGARSDLAQRHGLVSTIDEERLSRIQDA